MSLVYFHIFLMAVAVIFAFGFGIWEVTLYQTSHHWVDLLTAISSIVCGIAIFIYLFWFIRTKKPIMR